MHPCKLRVFGCDAAQTAYASCSCSLDRIVAAQSSGDAVGPNIEAVSRVAAACGPCQLRTVLTPSLAYVQVPSMPKDRQSTSTARRISSTTQPPAMSEPTLAEVRLGAFDRVGVSNLY